MLARNASRQSQKSEKDELLESKLELEDEKSSNIDDDELNESDIEKLESSEPYVLPPTSMPPMPLIIGKPVAGLMVDIEESIKLSEENGSESKAVGESMIGVAVSEKDAEALESEPRKMFLNHEEMLMCLPCPILP